MTAPAAGRALLLDDDSGCFLATARGLGRHFIEVHAAPANPRAPALRSRYIHAVHLLPAASDTAWPDAMETLLRNVPFDAVIPCSEMSLLALRPHRARFEALARLAIPHDEALAVLLDAHATHTLAKHLRIPVAPDPNPREAASRLVVSLLAQGGEVMRRFQHHLAPAHTNARLTGAPPDAALSAASIAMMAALRLSGPAAFEFDRYPEGDWILRHASAGIWPALPLPAGSDLAYRWYRQLVEPPPTAVLPSRKRLPALDDPAPTIEALRQALAGMFR